MSAWLFLTLSGLFWAGSGVRGRRPGGHLLLLVAIWASGATLATLSARSLVPAGIEGSPVFLEGQVERFQSGKDFSRLELYVVRAGAPEVEARFRARLIALEPTPLEVGQWVRVRARLKSLEGPDNPGEWDGRAWRERRTLFFSGSILPGSLIALSPPSPWRTWIRQEHAAMAKRVRRYSPSEEAAALYLTLAAGMRAELGEELEDAFSRSGLAHILSVSGLHVAALAVLLFKLLRWLLVFCWQRAVGVDARRWAAPLAIPLVWAYVAFTGWQVPAVRSAVMTSVVFIGLMLWRRADALNALAIAAMILTAIDPASPLELSLQLSFLAVASLILLTPAIRASLPWGRPGAESSRTRRVLETLLETLCAGVAVTVISLPLIAGTFGRVSVIGVLSNIVCLPLSAILTVLAAGGAALFVVSPFLSTPVLFAGAWGSELLVRASRGFAAVPWGVVEMPPFGWITTFGFFLGLACFVFGRSRWRWGAILAPLAVAVPLVGTPLFGAPGLTVTFLAVGQGDGIVVSSGGRHALVDGGGTPQGADTGKRFILPFLRQERIHALELTVLSHPHPDHALGLISTLRQLPTERLWVAAGTAGGQLTRELAASARRRSGLPTPPVEVELGARLRLGEAELEVLGPPTDRMLLEGVNDQSVVLRIRHGAVTILLTGDIEAAGEEALGDVGPVTVLKAPHHGSRTSSTEAFVQSVRPKHVVFCVGRQNRFGFPHREVVERYQEAGATCHRTDLGGALRVESDGSDVRLLPFHSPEERQNPGAVARRMSRRHLHPR